MEEQCEKGITEVAEGPSICTPSEPKVRWQPNAVLEESAFGTKIRLNRPFDEALDSVRRALHAQGFLVAFDMDVAAMLRADPGIKFPDYHIIGAWYPSYDREALQAEIDSGLLIPHNIIVYEQSDGTVVAAVDTIAQFALLDGAEQHELSILMKQRLQDVLDRVAGEGSERAA